MFDVRTLDGTMYLMEPRSLRRAVERIAAYPSCPTAREMARARRKAMGQAVDLEWHRERTQELLIQKCSDHMRRQLAAGTSSHGRSNLPPVIVIGVYGPL